MLSHCRWADGEADDWRSQRTLRFIMVIDDAAVRAASGKHCTIRSNHTFSDNLTRGLLQTAARDGAQPRGSRVKARCEPRAVGGITLDAGLPAPGEVWAQRGKRVRESDGGGAS
jgi:hypothetical protein